MTVDGLSTSEFGPLRHFAAPNINVAIGVTTDIDRRGYWMHRSRMTRMRHERTNLPPDARRKSDNLKRLIISHGEAYEATRIHHGHWSCGGIHWTGALAYTFSKHGEEWKIDAQAKAAIGLI